MYVWIYVYSKGIDNHVDVNQHSWVELSTSPEGGKLNGRRLRKNCGTRKGSRRDDCNLFKIPFKGIIGSFRGNDRVPLQGILGSFRRCGWG